MSDQPSDSIRYFNLKYRLNYNYEVTEEGKEEPELFSSNSETDCKAVRNQLLKHPARDERAPFQRSKEVVAPQS